MALQDLTPQLRTRMSRVERLVGLFVALAALLMIAAVGYYIVHTGKKRGWFIHKVRYFCFTREATGLKRGDPVRILGRPVGRILQVDTNPLDPWYTENNYNVCVLFEVWEPYFGYVLTDSTVRFVSADFLGARTIEVAPGNINSGLVTVVEGKFWKDTLVRSWKNTNDMVRIDTVPKDKGVWLQRVDEAPALAARAESLVRELADSLPHITSQVSQVLARANEATSNANFAIIQLQPALTNIQGLTARLRAEEGVIGRMMLTTNLQGEVEQNIVSMGAMLTNTTALIRTSEAQLQDLTRRIALTLDNVSLVTSNLSLQVSANGLFLGEVSSLVINADTMVQGLKSHWLLRSAFQNPTNTPSESLVQPSLDGPPR